MRVKTAGHLDHEKRKEVSNKMLMTSSGIKIYVHNSLNWVASKQQPFFLTTSFSAVKRFQIQSCLLFSEVFSESWQLAKVPVHNRTSNLATQLWSRDLDALGLAVFTSELGSQIWRSVIKTPILFSWIPVFL